MFGHLKGISPTGNQQVSCAVTVQWLAASCLQVLLRKKLEVYDAKAEDNVDQKMNNKMNIHLFNKCRNVTVGRGVKQQTPLLFEGDASKSWADDSAKTRFSSKE